MENKNIEVLKDIYPEEADSIIKSAKISVLVNDIYGGFETEEFAAKAAELFDVGLEKTASLDETELAEIEKMKTAGIQEQVAGALVKATKEAKTLVKIYKAAGMDVTLDDIHSVLVGEKSIADKKKIAMAVAGYSKEETIEFLRGEL